MPASEHIVALYATHLHHIGLKHSTIRTHLSAIAFYHKINSFPDPTKSFIINKLLTAYQRHDKPQPTRRPITSDLLLRILRCISATTLPSYHKFLFRALFSVMYFAALRVSEVTHSFSNNHNLTSEQVKVIHKGPRALIRIEFSSYKHSQGCPTPVVVHPTSSAGCPVELYMQYMTVRPSSNNAPAFCLQDSSPLSRPIVVETLRTLLLQLGFNSEEYNTHSFRIGRATDMSREGFSNTQIATLGRWKSNAFLQYIKPDSIHTP